MFLVHSAFMDIHIGAREIPLLQPAKSAAHDREIYSIGGSIMSSVVIAIAAFKLR
jgi:hypothetical protein